MFFMGIVKKEDADRSIFNPTYILCQAHGGSENRTGWRVVKTGSRYGNMNKVLVATPCGHDDMIAFLSNYRTRDHMHGSRRHTYESTKKYYPEGFLCWFTCNQFGDQIGEAILIKKVPDRTKRKTDDGARFLAYENERVIPLWEKFSKDDSMTDYPQTGVKPQLYQDRVPTGGEHAVTLK